MRIDRGAASRAFLLSFVLLLVVTDERSFGLLQDGQQMLSFATSLARFGEAGISREVPTAIAREGGDAVSRYGLACSVVEVPAVLASRLLVAARKGASTAPLFALTWILLLALASAFTADAAGRFGASRGMAVLAGVALTGATPLFAYAGADFSEPLQVAALAAFLDGVIAVRSAGEHRGGEVAAGAAAGVALLAKPFLLLLLAPLLLLVLRRRVLLGLLPLAALGAAFDLWRFGRLFGGYPGEGFTTPLATGLVRSLFLPNKGLLLYAPLVLLAPLGLWRLKKSDPRLALFLSISVALHLGAVASWWAWDGETGWGPRLVLPVLPLLVALAAAAVESARTRAAAFLLAAAGFLVNLLGVLVPFSGVYSIAALVPFAGPPSPQRLGLTPSWAPPRLHSRLLAERWKGGDVASRLSGGTLSDLEPPFVPVFPESPREPGVLEFPNDPHVEPKEAVEIVASPFAWPFWGRSWVAPLPGGIDPYRVALRDQAVRALESRDYERTLSLAGEIERTRGGLGPKDAAIGAEAAIRLGRGDEARAILGKVSAPCHLWMLFVEVEAGGEAECFPLREREGFRSSVAAAVREGTAVSAWGRKVRGGR